MSLKRDTERDKRGKKNVDTKTANESQSRQAKEIEKEEIERGDT